MSNPASDPQRAGYARGVGGDVSTTGETAAEPRQMYTCRMCRRVVFSDKDLENHQTAQQGFHRRKVDSVSTLVYCSLPYCSAMIAYKYRYFSKHDINSITSASPVVTCCAMGFHLSVGRCICFFAHGRGRGDRSRRRCYILPAHNSLVSHICKPVCVVNVFSERDTLKRGTRALLRTFSEAYDASIYVQSSGGCSCRVKQLVDARLYLYNRRRTSYPVFTACRYHVPERPYDPAGTMRQYTFDVRKLESSELYTLFF